MLTTWHRLNAWRHKSVHVVMWYSRKRRALTMTSSVITDVRAFVDGSQCRTWTLLATILDLILTTVLLGEMTCVIVFFYNIVNLYVPAVRIVAWNMKNTKISMFSSFALCRRISVCHSLLREFSTLTLPQTAMFYCNQLPQYPAAKSAWHHDECLAVAISVIAVNACNQTTE